MINEKLRKNYLDVSLPGSLSGLGNFYRALKERKIKISRNELKEWLKTQDTYTRHIQAKKRFKRNRVIVYGLDDLWQIDLADLQNISKFNDGTKYLVTCIDVFSKYAWVVPIKNKNAKTVLSAFQSIINESGRTPNNLQSDQGTEFLNKDFKAYLKTKDVGFYQVNSELKASVVERFNRTIKEKIYRYFTSKNTNNYISVLNHLVKSYNNSFHRSIKTAPAKVNKTNEKKIYRILFKDVTTAKKKDFKFNVGDSVRISKYKRIFQKGYTPTWTEEIFIITNQIPRDPPVYKIRDLNNEQIQGIFYEPELQKVTNTGIYIVNRIIKSRIIKGRKQYFVSWQGYPSSFNSWVEEEDIDRNYFK